METNSPKAQLAKYFSAWLRLWMQKHRYTQLQAAIRLDVTPGFLNMVLNSKRAASAWQMEKIATATKMDVLEILYHGREAIEGKKTLLPTATPVENSFTVGLDNEQVSSLRNYHKLLLAGGEGVNIIAESINFLVKNKNIS